MTAKEYFVDFELGSDSSDGLTAQTPWKHSPGDANAASLARTTILRPGDKVNFRGGAVYNGSVSATFPGSAASNISFRTGPGWGNGRAILDGLGTMPYGFDAAAPFVMVSDLEVRNFTSFGIRAYDGTPNGLIVSNNIVHHIGRFPYDPNVDSGTGITLNNGANYLVVSNEVFDCNLKAINGNNLITNTIVWGNHLHHCQDDGINLWAWGYTLIAYNTIHDCTNTVRHADAMQILGFPPGSPLIVAGNIVFDCTQGFFIEPYNAIISKPTVFKAGQMYQVITNSAFFGNDVRYVYNGVTYRPGDKFAATGSSPGIWAADAGAIKEYFPAGKCYLFNNVFTRTLDKKGAGSVSGLDAYVDTDLFWVVNNTFINALFDNSPRDPWCRLGNSVFANNLMVNSVRGNITFNGGPVVDDFNQYTNSLSNVTFGGGLTLSAFQAANFGHEVHSITAPVVFANPAQLDFRVLSSGGVGRGTTITGPDLSFLPVQWRPDPARDFLGRPRPAACDMGAFQRDQGPSAPTGFRIVQQ